MGKKKPDLVSALPPLAPKNIVDLKTGELVEQIIFEHDLQQLVSYVQEQSEQLWEEQKDTLGGKLEEITATSPAEVGRQAGVNPDLEMLGRDVKAKSRIERLIRYNVITSAKSYYNSEVETKEEPSFAPYLNLGAVDAQMATITRIDDDHFELVFKCWENEYLLTFKLPFYILERKITKITLPTIKQWGEGWGFVFNLEEKSETPITSNKYAIGIDLGRVEPYTLAVVHISSRSRVAQYTASPRLRSLIAKRDRLNKELYHLALKSETYEALGIEQGVLESERRFTRAKRNRVMDKISWQIAKEIEQVSSLYAVPMVSMEDLSWVNPKHGMSRWTYSQDQAAINHKLARSGRKTRKVNAANTSKECSKCGGFVIQQSGKRLVVCSDCSIIFDRDVNAAVNIALRPLPKRSKGNNCSSIEQVMVFNHPSKRLLTRNTS